MDASRASHGLVSQLGNFFKFLQVGNCEDIVKSTTSSKQQLGRCCIMGNSTSHRQKNDQRLQESNQLIGILLRKAVVNSNKGNALAIIATDESIDYIDRIIDFLFQFHLSLYTLHFYILLQVRQIIKLCNLLQSFTCIKTPTSNRFRIRCKHSCEIIANNLCEDSMITKEIGKKIFLLYNDSAIQNTLKLVTSLNTEAVTHNSSTSDIDVELQEYLKSLLLSNEMKIDVAFCQFYFENISDYCCGLTRRFRNTPVIFSSRKKYQDCQLLKQHIINTYQDKSKKLKQNDKLKLCHNEIYSNVYFTIGRYMTYQHLLFSNFCFCIMCFNFCLCLLFEIDARNMI